MATLNGGRIRIVVCKGANDYEIGLWSNCSLAKRVLQVPLKVTYSELKEKVATKFSLSMESGFRMIYPFPLFSSYLKETHVSVDVADDEDVEVFMDITVKVTNQCNMLYVFPAVVPGEESHCCSDDDDEDCEAY